jgi:hypothetical protein
MIINTHFNNTLVFTYPYCTDMIINTHFNTTLVFTYPYCTDMIINTHFNTTLVFTYPYCTDMIINTHFNTTLVFTYPYCTDNDVQVLVFSASRSTEAAATHLSMTHVEVARPDDWLEPTDPVRGGFARGRGGGRVRVCTRVCVSVCVVWGLGFAV